MTLINIEAFERLLNFVDFFVGENVGPFIMKSGRVAPRFLLHASFLWVVAFLDSLPQVG